MRALPCDCHAQAGLELEQDDDDADDADDDRFAPAVFNGTRMQVTVRLSGTPSSGASPSFLTGGWVQGYVTYVGV
jgi:hypothetical protein